MTTEVVRREKLGRLERMKENVKGIRHNLNRCLKGETYLTLKQAAVMEGVGLFFTYAGMHDQNYPLMNCFAFMTALLGANALHTVKDRYENYRLITQSK